MRGRLIWRTWQLVVLNSNIGGKTSQIHSSFTLIRLSTVLPCMRSSKVFANSSKSVRWLELFLWLLMAPRNSSMRTDYSHSNASSSQDIYLMSKCWSSITLTSIRSMPLMYFWTKEKPCWRKLACVLASLLILMSQSVVPKSYPPRCLNNCRSWPFATHSTLRSSRWWRTLPASSLFLSIMKTACPSAQLST